MDGIASVSSSYNVPDILPSAVRVLGPTPDKAIGQVTAEAVSKVIAPPVVAPAVPSESELKLAIDAIKKFLTPNSSDLEFAQDKDTGITLVKVVDTATGKVIRQIPTQQILDISKDIVRLQGLLLKEKA